MKLDHTFAMVRLLALALLGAPALATAQVEVDINQGQVQPLPIALPDFTGMGEPRAQALGGRIAQVVAADLESSGFFRPLPKASFPSQPLDVALQPRFEDWRPLGAQALVDGRTEIDGNGRLRAAFRLWDVAAGQQLDGVELSASPDEWRKVAHRIADAVYQHLTGEEGYFDTRIAFVAESGPRAHRVKKLAIMDQDGADPQFLTSGEEQVLTPRFGASDQELTYMALRSDSARVYVENLDTARHEALAGIEGEPSAPRFSPDGARVALSISRGGNTDIFVMNLRSQTLTRLTRDPAIDTSPAFSPDGSKIVFNSDRGGSPQLYVMNADGSNPKRISFGKGRYTTPVWSPKGDLIAFTRQDGAEFHIGVMATDGSGERTLTSSGLDEGPTFAPNGRVLMFARETAGGSRLWTVDVSGRILRPSAYAGAASDPAWSPRLK